jgi:hypothetical protein
LAINQGYGVLITDQDGQIRWPTDKGFYHSDTRVISSWRIFADGAGRGPSVSSASQIRQARTSRNMRFNDIQKLSA